MDPSLQPLLARLDRLSDEFREVREGIRRAVRIAGEDPEMALTRCRKVLELVVREVYERRCQEPPGTRPLENLLQRIAKDGHLPARLAAYAGTVRELGNAGTHRFGEEVTAADVSRSLSHLDPILEWYFGAERPDAVVGKPAGTRPPKRPDGTSRGQPSRQSAPAVEAGPGGGPQAGPVDLATRLIGFGLRQVLGGWANPAEAVIGVVEQYFADHSQTLPKALARANDRAWQALGIALAGDGFLDRLQVLFADGDAKGIREQVGLFLKSNAIPFEGSPADFRTACLAELKKVRQAGLLSAGNLSPQEIARQAAGFRRYTDPQGLVDAATQAVARVADDLAPHALNLARLLRQPTPGGPPLLVSAFAYFFRREVETDEELAHGLLFDGLRQLTASQARAFGEIHKVLGTLGERFEEIFEQQDRIEAAVVETGTTAAATLEAVLDLHAELQRLGGLQLANAEEVRFLLLTVQQHLGRAGMQQGEVRPQHSFSIRGEEERRAVKTLLARFRHLPPEEQEKVPALLNGLGKLQVGAGDFAGAGQTFGEVARAVDDAAAQAEAHHNAYRAALEQRKWDEALAALQQAVALDAGRFAPFPLHRYQLRRVLGAGGFGTAILCLDRHFDEEVVVKTLHAVGLDRGLDEVFREARTLRQLSHPAIIGVRDCEYADPMARARPYLVMDYFPGDSLEAYLKEHGPLPPADLLAVARQVASGIQEAHACGILHRDLKPANVLVHKEGGSWRVKVIDFGLALRRQAVETSLAGAAAGNTLVNESVAGTLKYAPPEQLGESRGIKVGPYSDVYAFGKLCCYSLFRTTEPKRRQWAAVPEELVEVLEHCTEQELEHRHLGFEPVLAVLEALDPARKVEERPRQQEEARRQKEAEQREEEEDGRQDASGQESERGGQEEAMWPTEEIPQIELTLPGWWFARPADCPGMEWREVARTPGKLSPVVGEVYRLSVEQGVTDKQLESLADLQGLTLVRELCLGDCRGVTDAGLVHLGGLTGLRTLVMSSTQVREAGLAHLRGLTGLEVLSLMWTPVTDAGLAHLSGLTGLILLSLNRCSQVTDAGLAHLGGLTGLVDLDLFDIPVTDAGLAHLGGLARLQVLELGNAKVTDAGLAHLKGLTGLRRLSLYNCKRVTDAGLAHLRTLTGLQQLYLNGTKVTDAGLAHLRGLTSLYELHLEGCNGVRNAGLSYLRGLPSLRILGLLSTGVTKAGLAHLRGLTALKTLYLSHTQVKNAGLADLQRALPECLITASR